MDGNSGVVSDTFLHDSLCDRFRRNGRRIHPHAFNRCVARCALRRIVCGNGYGFRTVRHGSDALHDFLYGGGNKGSPHGVGVYGGMYVEFFQPVLRCDNGVCVLSVVRNSQGGTAVRRTAGKNGGKAKRRQNAQNCQGKLCRCTRRLCRFQERQGYFVACQHQSRRNRRFRQRQTYGRRRRKETACRRHADSCGANLRPEGNLCRVGADFGQTAY